MITAKPSSFLEKIVAFVTLGGVKKVPKWAAGNDIRIDRYEDLAEPYYFNSMIARNSTLEHCTYCRRTVVDEAGEKTEDFGSTRHGRHICVRCMKALEFALGD